MAGKQKIKLNNLFFYGVSFAEYDSVDITRDIITNIRMRFLVSGKSASNKLYRSAGGDNFVYSYNFTQGKPLQWRVVKNKHVLEEIEHLFSEKYCINFYDNKGHDFKKVFFDSKHRWFKSNYYNTVSNESLTCSLVPKEFDEGTSILKYMTGAVYPERLYSCPIPTCNEVRRRVLDRIKTPDVTAMTNIGVVYFLPEEDMDFYKKVLAEEEAAYALENAPKVYISAEEAEGGFNLSVDDFDMAKNLNHTLDISMAEDFFTEESEESEVPITVVEVDEIHETNTEPQTEEESVSDILSTDNSTDDGSVDAAITGVVQQINRLTSLEINAEDILNVDVNAMSSSDGETASENESFVFDDNDPAIDAQLKHIDSVLDGTSLLNSDRKLVIGDSVVDDDYISSIIDGIISSAFSADDEVAGVADETPVETPVALEEKADETEVSEDASPETEENFTADVNTALVGSVDEEVQNDADENISEEATEITAQDESGSEESTDLTSDAIVEEISLKAAMLISEALSDKSEEIPAEVTADLSADLPAEIPAEVSVTPAEVVVEPAEIAEDEAIKAMTSIASAEDYIKETPADITIESRGESYYYYGSVDENGKRSGRGRTLMSDGSIAYEGEYLDDKRKGQGSFYFKDGSLCYWGNWDNNVRSGFGVGVSSEDKAVHAGNWADNKPKGLGIRFDADGNLMFISSSCEDKKKGFTISDFSDTSFTIRAWSEKDDAFIQREISINDIIK